MASWTEILREPVGLPAQKVPYLSEMSHLIAIKVQDLASPFVAC